jgi:uncharacterized iron-regulated membrane protein
VGLIGLRAIVRRLHFWLGAFAMLYIVFVSVTGCAIVFEHELYGFFLPDPRISLVGAKGLDTEGLRTAATSQYPDSVVIGIWQRRISAGMVAEVWLDGPNGASRRLFHPDTGEDLGDAQPSALRFLAFLRRAHVMALAGKTGQTINATGALALSAVSISGLLARRRRPSPTLNMNVRVYHSAVGAWASIFGTMWGITGACFAFSPALASLLGPVDEPVSVWLYALHSGSAAGTPTRILWAIVALSLSFLTISGTILLLRRTLVHVKGWSQRTGASRNVRVLVFAMPDQVTDCRPDGRQSAMHRLRRGTH